MNEPTFWLETDDAPPEVRELLSLAEAPRALDLRSRERSRRTVLALASVPMAAGVLFWVQNLALGALLGGAVSVGAAASYGVLSRSAPPPVEASRAVRAVPPLAAASAKPPAESALVPEPVSEEASQAFSKPRGHNLSAPTPLVDDGGVEREVRLLEAARRTLDANPKRALVLLEEHEREFPTGVLTAEREFLAIDALARSGRARDAEARARRLRERVPGSLYEERLERILGKGK